MFLLSHRRNVTYVLEINVVMITTSLQFRSPHKHGGGGCRRSRNNTQKNNVQEKDVTKNMNSESNDADDLNVDNPMNT